MNVQHSVIIGGSSGIGLASARRLLMKEHRVTIAGRREDRLNAASEDLNGDVTTLVLDASDWQSLPAAFARIGAFNHLILALGSDKGVGRFASINLADVRQGFDDKVFPHFAAAQAALPLISKDGSITFISAVTAKAAMPGTAGIAAANAAIAALIPILAVELRPLRVNGVAPGVIDTPWWDFLDEDQKCMTFADFAKKTPVGRVGSADDVARAVAFLVNDSFVTGDVIKCDGGLSLIG